MKNEVINFLIKHFGMAKEDALKAVETEAAQKEIKQAVAFASRPHYPAGLIADSLGINHLEPCPECEKEEEDEE